MHVVAENLNGWLAAALGFFIALLASLLALIALVPATRGNRAATLAMAAPAFFIGLALTIAVLYGFVTGGIRNPDYTASDFLVPWLVMAGPPLATSVLAATVLWFRTRTRPA